MSHVVWDIETQTHTLFKRKASPWHPQNFVVSSGYKRAKGEPVYIRHADGRMPQGWFTQMLAGTKVLVGFNIAFDLLWALQEQENLDAWMDWIAKGGQVWDVQLVESVLDGMVQEPHRRSLKELAALSGGPTTMTEA